MPVPAVVVKPVGCALFQAVALAAEQTKVPPLNVKFFVPVVVPAKVVFVRVNPAKSSVPLASVVVAFRPALARVVVIPAALIVNELIRLPAYVNVPVPTIITSAAVIAGAADNVNPWQKIGSVIGLVVVIEPKLISLKKPKNRIRLLGSDDVVRVMLSLLDDVAPVVLPKRN